MSEREVRRYDFWQLAKRNCAECTTTITTTQQERFVLATDYEAEHQRRVKAEGALERIASIDRSDTPVAIARAHLARYKEDGDGTA